MIIKGKPLSPFFYKFVCFWVELILKCYLRKFKLRKVDLNPNHSYILMSNHFSFLDGLFAFYITRNHFFKPGYMKQMHIMSLKRQMQKNPWLRLIGSFSVDPGKLSIQESFSHAANLLNQPGNLLLFYPQGNLESLHVREIYFEDGLNQIVPQIIGPCQIIWSSNIIEYFEGVRPEISFNLLDCGLVKDYDFKEIQERINHHHQDVILKGFRFTLEKN